MASLISPRPLSHMQNSVLYNPYGRPGLMSYVDAQNAVVGAPLALTPDQSNLGPYGDGGAQAAANMAVHEEQKIYNLVIDLLEPVTREGALLELSKKREQFDELALVLWHSFGKHLFCRVDICFLTHPLPGIMPALLQEIVSVYPLLSPPNLTAHVSNRVCNALALLQCVASHPDTRQLFLNG